MAKEESKTSGEEVTLTQVLARLAEIAEASQGVQKAQLKQTAPRSNAAVPKISVFNPRGEKDYPMPLLKCVIQPFNQSPNDHGFTREEVELINRLEPGTFRVELNDGTHVVCELVGERDVYGRLERLSFYGSKDVDSGHYGPFYTRENKLLFPALAPMVRQMLEQQNTDHADILTMRKERELVAKGELAVSLGE